MARRYNRILKSRKILQKTKQIVQRASKFNTQQNLPTITSTFTLQNDTVTVLLIDDQAIVGETVRQILTHEKDILFHYISAPTQAIQKAVEITPTVILLDLVIPGIDGLMLLRWFRFYEATRDIPIVILSGKEEPELKAEAFAQGANDYLIKLP
ncbi:hypothetical protein NUACC26_070250 [Scytonema sp. NUACC26]